MNDDREGRVIDTFLSLADTSAHDEAADLLTTLTEAGVELLDVSAAAVVLVDGHGTLSVAASSSERLRLLETFAVAIDAGPCADVLRTGRPVTSDDLTAPTTRRAWPHYTQGAEAAGFRAAHALPMRLRDETVGVLALLHIDPHSLTGPDTRLAQALADAATVGLLHERAARRSRATHDQLRGALASRAIIEQAKGMLAQQGALTPDDAFTVLRTHARSHGKRLTDLAHDVVAGTVDLTDGTRPTL